MRRRMVQSACQPPGNPAPVPLALSTLRRRDPRGKRLIATTPNALSLRDLRVGCITLRAGIRWPQAGSVGRQSPLCPDHTSRHGDARRSARSLGGLSGREV